MKLAPMKPKRPVLSESEVKAAAKEMAEDPEERLVKISVRVPASFRRRFRLLATERDLEMQNMVVDALLEKYPELRDTSRGPAT